MATKRKAKSRGQWQKNESAWYEQSLSYCDACGMLLPKNQLVVESGSKILRFCSNECEQLFSRLEASAPARFKKRNSRR